MKALEFQARISADATLAVPAELAAQPQREQPGRVILLIPESGEEDWNRLTADRFLKGYAESDAIYDKLSAG